MADGGLVVLAVRLRRGSGSKATSGLLFGIAFLVLRIAGLAAETEPNHQMTPMLPRELTHLEQLQIEAVLKESLHNQDTTIHFRWQPLKLPRSYCAYAGNIPFYVILIWQKHNLVSITPWLIGADPKRAKYVIDVCTDMGYRL